MKKLLAFTLCAMLALAGAAAHAASLTGGQMLHRGEELLSDNGQYTLVLQAGDGNLVIYRRADNHVMWSTYKPGGEVAKVQEDHNFVVYKAGALLPVNAIWNSRTDANVFDVNTKLTMGDDGYLRLTDGSNRLMWTTAPPTGPCPGGQQYVIQNVCYLAGTPNQFQTIQTVCPGAPVFYPYTLGFCPFRPN